MMMSNDKILSSLNRPSLLICSLCFSTTAFLCFYVRWAPINVPSFVNNFTSRHSGGDETASSCDIFKGRWIRDEGAPLYTNGSCKTVPDPKNCLLNGRRDQDFLHWRWEPHQCQLPIFQPSRFLGLVRGKALAFVGDSVGRNQMDSLICLLSTEETPVQVYKDAKDRFTKWQFPRHNFTLLSLWSRFLVNASETVINGSVTGGFDLHLDEVDHHWAHQLPAIDIAIFSDGQWFLRQNYLYEGGNLVGCIYCQQPNLTDLGPSFAIRRAFQTAFKYINNCRDCSGILALLRTFSPSHFENGTWKTGGSCLRTSPLSPEEIDGSGGADWDYRNIQVAEVENAQKIGQRKGNVFGILDVTEAMVMRPDGHPGLHWRTKKKGYSDCVHWCMPGPIDMWNELLFEVLRRHSPFPLRPTRQNVTGLF